MTIPDDASPRFAARLRRIQEALERHGSLNTYYLHNATCTFHLTNDPVLGLITFEFEGTMFTDSRDEKSMRSELTVRLEKEDCDWLHQGIVTWFEETVRQAVRVEFDRYIAAGDLERTRERIAAMEKTMDSQFGFLGMHL